MVMIDDARAWSPRKIVKIRCSEFTSVAVLAKIMLEPPTCCIHRSHLKQLNKMKGPFHSSFQRGKVVRVV